MIRFILKRTMRDGVTEWTGTSYETIDVEVPALEIALRSGGYGESGFDYKELVGVELIAVSPTPEVPNE